MKTYIGINAQFTPCGQIIPKEIISAEDKTYIIDSILDVRPAASLKSGGCGMRYTVRIRNREYFLFFDDKCWFIESAV